METLSWTRLDLDKSTWGEGPWQDEDVDKMQFEDKYTGMPCLAVRNHFGNWCGYVGVTADHPLFGIDYNECAHKPQCAPETDEGGNEWWDCKHRPDTLLRVHGGLTFSGPSQQTDDPSHGISHVPAPGEPAEVWWFGFDAAHAWDLVPGLNALSRELGGSGQLIPGETYKTLTYVQAACATLCDQLDDRDFADEHHLRD